MNNIFIAAPRNSAGLWAGGHLHPDQRRAGRGGAGGRRPAPVHLPGGGLGGHRGPHPARPHRAVHRHQGHQGQHSAGREQYIDNK